jgi:hypothetical protein
MTEPENHSKIVQMRAFSQEIALLTKQKPLQTTSRLIFITRRGLCCNIYSDNATNFVGANKQLKEFYQVLTSDEVQQEIHNYSSRNLIQWNFILPRAPNFGGPWEAAIKSTKFHLIRILGSALLT